MYALDKEFPAYRWLSNKGYPTKDHRQAIRQCGPTAHHRLTFTLLPEQLILDL
jgi:ribonuclease HII